MALPEKLVMLFFGGTAVISCLDFIKLDAHEKAKQKQRADKIITEKITEGKRKVHMEVLE